MQTAADGQWMEGPLREELPRDTQDGASKREDRKSVIALPNGEGSSPGPGHRARVFYKEPRCCRTTLQS